MKKEGRYRNILRAFNHYLLFFLIVSFVITCCMLLFLSVLTATLNVSLTNENVEKAAKLTFINVILISLIFTVIDAIRRKITVQRPVERISEATEKMMQGDFSVRIKPQSRFGTDERFLEIIECFNKMAQELSSVEMLRTDFIANVSHELKTPLAAMQNYATLLLSPELSDEKRMEYARGVSDGTRRLADMMSNILKLNRLENQQIYPQASVYDLGEQLCECILQYESVWEKKNIDIETDLAEHVTICADAELLSLVWNNLLSNAFKFTEEGGKVTITLQATEEEVSVSICDTGCGISAQTGAHIFEKFYQGDTSHSVQGNGLGLALVKRVLSILGGEIGVESTVGVGSVFTVRLQRKL